MVILSVFHFEISGRDDIEEYPENKYVILVTLFLFNFEISGRDDNDVHPENI